MTQKPNINATRTPRGRSRGFSAVSGLVEKQVRTSGEKRGFAVMRLLTHWEEIVGADVSTIATPVNVSYAKEGFGATLTLLTNGANAPILQQQLPQIQTKVNACYGYHAISRIRVTQTAPVGFHDGQRIKPDGAPARTQQDVPPEVKSESRNAARDVTDSDLKSALERLGENVLTKARSPKRN